MKTHLTLTLALILSLGLIGFALAQDVERAARSDGGTDASKGAADRAPDDDEALARSIDDLGSASFDVREKAMKTLREAGEEAIPHLEKAREHADPEVRWRSGALLREMRQKPRAEAGGEADPFDAARRLFEMGDVDGDGKPDIRFEFPDLDSIREQMLENQRIFRQQLEQMPRPRVPDVEWPRFDLDLRGGQAKGFRMQTNPDGSVTIEKLENGQWVPASEKSSHTHGMKLGVPGEALRAQLSIDAGTGLLVEDVESGGAGAKSGPQKYDIILTVNGEKVTGVSDFEEKMRATPEGKDAVLEVIRKAQTVRFELPVQRLKKI